MEEKKPNAKEILSRIQEGEGKYDFSLKEEKKEAPKISREEEIIREEINREIKLIEQDENLKKESETKTKQIQFLGGEEKLEHLLKIAKQKGVAFAVKVANDMKDPYILDLFHDVLVREGLWKSFKE